MYDELKKRLREIHPEEFGNAWDFAFACQQAMHEAADAITELTDLSRRQEVELVELTGELASKPRWIPVEEAQPTSQGPFFTRYGFGAASRETGQYFFGARYYLFADLEPHWQDESLGVEVTHWMPIPPMQEEAPKEE